MINKKRMVQWLSGIAMLFPSTLIACTNFLITPNASTDGSSMISYAADSHDLYGELYHWPAKDHQEGTLLDIYEWDTGKPLGKIKQVKHTYSVIGNMNEHQLSIAETTFTGRKELQDTTGVIDYGSLIYITLQRAKTAREAIKVMTDLVKKYGYYSTGESFSIADPKEVWIMEMIGKGPGQKGAVWVALRIPDGYVSGHANQSRITTFPLKPTTDCLFAEDVRSFAMENNFYEGKERDFSFSDAYAPLDFGALRFCEARVWSGFNIMSSKVGKFESHALGDSTGRMPLWIKPDKKISRKDLMNIMRDHYEGSQLDMTQDIGAGPFKSPYRFRPLTWEVDSTKYFNERAIATQQTAFSFVAQMRDWYDDPIGGILWFGVDDAASTVYLPMYCGITKVPECLAVNNGSLTNFTWNSAFWVFNWVANQAYGRYSYMIKDIKKQQKELEDKFDDYGTGIDQAAKIMYDSNPRRAQQFLTEYSSMQAASAVNQWRELGQLLMVKYLDGNLHEETNGVFHKNPYGGPAHAKFPGYSENFYKKIIEETGDKFQMKELKQ